MKAESAIDHGSRIASRTRSLFFVVTFLGPVAAAGVVPGAASAARFITLYQFQDGSDAFTPTTALTQDADNASLSSNGGYFVDNNADGSREAPISPRGQGCGMTRARVGNCDPSAGLACAAETVGCGEE
jgi:hypothetical protein